jgi:hypothetical protein
MTLIFVPLKLICDKEWGAATQHVDADDNVGQHLLCSSYTCMPCKQCAEVPEEAALGSGMCYC